MVTSLIKPATQAVVLLLFGIYAVTRFIQTAVRRLLYEVVGCVLRGVGPHTLGTGLFNGTHELGQFVVTADEYIVDLRDIQQLLIVFLDVFVSALHHSQRGGERRSLS